MLARVVCVLLPWVFARGGMNAADIGDAAAAAVPCGATASAVARWPRRPLRDPAPLEGFIALCRVASERRAAHLTTLANKAASPPPRAKRFVSGFFSVLWNFFFFLRAARLPAIRRALLFAIGLFFFFFLYLSPLFAPSGQPTLSRPWHVGAARPRCWPRHVWTVRRASRCLCVLAREQHTDTLCPWHEERAKKKKNKENKSRPHPADGTRVRTWGHLVCVSLLPSAAGLGSCLIDLGQQLENTVPIRGRTMRWRPANNI